MSTKVENRYNRACLDMDGTVADFDQAMQKALVSLMGPGESLEDNIREREDSLPYMKARRSMIKRLPGFWATLPRIEDGFKVLKMLDDEDFITSILTKAPKSIGAAYQEKWIWLKEHPETEERPIMMVEEKHLVYGRILVDDWPEYYFPWLEARPRGCVIAIKQEWNKDTKHPRLCIYDGTNDDEVRHFIREAKKEVPTYRW